MLCVRLLTALAMLAAAAGAQTVRAPSNAAAAQPKAVVPAARPKTPAAQSRVSDSQMEADIRARLARSKKISQDHLQVHVQGGVATIEGRTGVVQHKGSATRMAKAAGALAVNNRVEISEAAKEKAAANLETGRRRAQIKRGDSRSETRSAAPAH
jgi:osmotically-inducible protein OsmY